MKLSEVVEKRFQELIDRGEKILSAAIRREHDTIVDYDDASQWVMSALAVLKSTLGEDNDNYVEVKKNLPQCWKKYVFGESLAYVKAAHDDLKGGYFFDKKSLIEAGVFDDLLEQSKELLSHGYKDAAAVLIGAVLEMHLRSMCERRNIGPFKANGKPKTMNDFNDELTKAGAYNVLKSKQIAAWADLRNKAAHGHHHEYTRHDVESLLRDVSAFCANVM